MLFLADRTSTLYCHHLVVLFLRLSVCLSVCNAGLIAKIHSIVYQRRRPPWRYLPAVLHRSPCIPRDISAYICSICRICRICFHTSTRHRSETRRTCTTAPKFSQQRTKQVINYFFILLLHICFCLFLYHYLVKKTYWKQTRRRTRWAPPRKCYNAKC